jgi:pilus assembly protein TadC
LSLSSFLGHSYKRFCGLVPLGARKKLFHYIQFAGVTKDPEFWLGKRILLSIVSGIVGFALSWIVAALFRIPDHMQAFAFGVSILVALVFAAAAVILYYLSLYYRVENRTSLVEEVLPDFLLLVASNINASLTPFSAFRAAARKEFGPLSDEIKIATSKSMGTESFQQALQNIGKKINSRALQETIMFFTQATKSGGRLSKLLETSANDLRQSQELKKELVSSTRMYVIFVAFVVIVGTPLLLAVSGQFVEMVTNIQSENQFDSSDAGMVGFLSTKLDISNDFMNIAAILLLIANAALSSMFIGLISTGKPLLGLKFAPVILCASFIVFIISRLLLGSILGGT